MLPTGTGRLLRLALRRDRWLLPFWLLLVGALLVGQVAALRHVYTNTRAREAYASVTSGNLAARMFGAVDGETLGSITMVEIYGLLAILVALVAGFSVIRHTRADETSGRLELVCGSAVDRRASLTAALILVTGSSVLIGAVAVGSLLAIGLPAGGSMLMGASLGVLGVAFASIGAIAGQVAATPRGARGLVGIAVMVAWLVRAVGDVAGTTTADGLGVRINWASWLSPLGWGELAYPFTDARWLALAPAIVVAVALGAVALMVEVRRDIGPGLLRPRPRPGSASRALRWPRSPRARSVIGPVGLVWHQQRGIFLGWTAGGVASAAFVGAFVGEIDQLMGANPEARDYFLQLTGGVTKLSEAYLAVVLSMMGVLAAAYVIQALGRLREEEHGPLETLLATSLSRTAWLASHMLVTIIGAAVLIMSVGLATVAATTIAGQASVTPEAGVIAGAAVQVAALLVVAGVVSFAFAWLPRWAIGLGWAMLGICLLTHFGPMLRIPDVIIDLSPFTHLPQMPGESFDPVPVLALGVAGLALLAASLWRFRGRDIVMA